MLIDCATCIARDIACSDCVVTVLLSRPPALPVRSTQPVRTAVPTRTGVPTQTELTVGSEAGDALALDEAEQVALGALARAGLVPPLRLVRPLGTPHGLPDTA